MLSRCRPTQGPELVTEQRMGAGGPVLDAAHVQHRGIELHLVPTQVAKLGCPKPVPEGQQDHGGVPVPVSIGLGGFDQGLDLAGGEVFARTKLCVRSPCRRNCS